MWATRMTTTAVRFATATTGTATATAEFDEEVGELVAAMKKRRPCCAGCLEIDILYTQWALLSQQKSWQQARSD